MGNRTYESTHTRQIALKLNIRTDKDILNYLDTRDNKQGYIKKLVRRDMAGRTNSEEEKMTSEEAIAFFKDMSECTYGSLEPIEMAIQALQKATPKKYKMDIDTAICPECGSEIECQSIIEGEILYHQQFEYCPNCGQAINWEV